MKKTLLSFLFLFLLSFLMVQPAQAAKVVLSEDVVIAGKTESIKLINYKTEKKISGKYSWSISSPEKVITIESGKNSSTVKLKCKKFGYKDGKAREGEFWEGTILKCRVKNKKGKVLYNKKFRIYGRLREVDSSNIFLLPDTTKDIIFKVPSYNSFVYFDDLYIKKNVDPFKNSFKDCSYTLPPYPKRDITIHIKPNTSAKERALGVSFTSDDTIYFNDILQPEKNYYAIDTVDEKNNNWKYCLADEAINMSCAKSVSSVKKGNPFYISCGAEKGTKYEIISGDKLIKTLISQKEYRAGDSYEYLKKDPMTDKKDKFNTFDSRTNAYVTCGVYQAKKKGTVKVKITYPDKSTKTIKIKIK